MTFKRQIKAWPSQHKKEKRVLLKTAVRIDLREGSVDAVLCPHRRFRLVLPPPPHSIKSPTGREVFIDVAFSLYVLLGTIWSSPKASGGTFDE